LAGGRALGLRVQLGREVQEVHVARHVAHHQDVGARVTRKAHGLRSTQRMGMGGGQARVDGQHVCGRTADGDWAGVCGWTAGAWMDRAEIMPACHAGRPVKDAGSFRCVHTHTGRHPSMCVQEKT